MFRIHIMVMLLNLLALIMVDYAMFFFMSSKSSNTCALLHLCYFLESYQFHKIQWHENAHVEQIFKAIHMYCVKKGHRPLFCCVQHTSGWCLIFLAVVNSKSRDVDSCNGFSKSICNEWVSKSGWRQYFDSWYHFNVSIKM